MIIEVKDIEILGIVTFGSKETLATGPTGNGIASIELTSTVGLVKTYTITYTNGTTTTFEISDGEDGSTPVITFVGTVIYVDGVAGPDLKGEQGDPGPNEVSTDTDSSLDDGLIKTESGKLVKAVGAIDYMPAYNIDDFDEWETGIGYFVGDTVYVISELITNRLVYSNYICKEAHTSTTGPDADDSDKWILVNDIIDDLRLDSVTGIPLCDGEGGVTAAVPAIDYMPAYDPSEFVAWQDETVYDIGDKVTASIPKYLLYLICKKEHISDTTYDPTKFITVYVQDIRLDTIEGIVVIDTEGNSSAAAQSDIEEILTGEITSHTHQKEVQLVLIDGATTLATGDGQAEMMIPPSLNNYYIVACYAAVSTASSSGLPTFQIRKNSTDLLSTKLTIDATELTSLTATAGAEIITANSQVASGDQVYIDCDVAGTGAKGAKVVLLFSTTFPS
jgi:hypothetical protein